MFHYRNHGAAFGRVFLALQIPTEKKSTINSFLEKLNYNYVEENDNPAYELFLS